MMLDPEQKLVPLVDANPLTFNGQTYLLNGAPQGVTQVQRQGFQQLNISSLISYRVLLEGGAGVTNTVVRVSLIWWKQPRGLDLDLNNIYDGMGTTFAPNGHRNLLDAFQYRTLWTRIHRMDLAHQTINVTVFKRLNRLTRYNTVNAAFGDFSSGGLWLVALSDQEAAPLPAFQFSSRVRFVG